MTLAVVGPHGCGKTTALGKLCELLGTFPEENHAQCKNLASELGQPLYQHGWMLDKLPAEREKGMTITPSLQSFSSQTFNYTALDTPGSEGLSKNMLCVTSLADTAVVVVSAAEGEWEAASASGRAKELALDCFTMGIKNVVVLVNKMDDVTVQYTSPRFEEIKKVMSAILKEVGYKQKDVPCVPIAGLSGDNLMDRSQEMTWYSGPTTLEALDAIGAINRPAEKPLRLPVLKVHDIPEVGTVAVGRVETGSIRAGLKVIFSPSGLVAEVRCIQKDGKDVSEGTGGDIVGVCLSGVEASEIQRGMVMSGSNDPAADAETFQAQVVVLDHPGEIKSGYCPAIAVHTAQVPCEFEELIAKIDRKTGKEAETNPLSAKTGEVVTVKIRPRSLVCVETFSAYPPLGRFAIRDHGRTIGVGVIKEVSKRPVPKPRRENQYFDE